MVTDRIPTATGERLRRVATAVDLPPLATGKVKFALTFIGDGSSAIGASAVAFDGLGNVYAGGSYRSSTTIDLGNGKSLPANSTQVDGFIAKFDATGKCLWTSVLSSADNGDEFVVSLAVAPNGDAVFAAQTRGSTSVKLDSAPVATRIAEGIALGRLNASGQQVFLRTLASAGYTYPEAIAVDGTGRIALTGKYTREAIDPAFDGIVANPPLTPTPKPIGFLAILNSSGVTTALKAFPSPLGSVSHAVAFAPDGNVVVGGEFEGTVELRFGESPGQAAPSAGSNDAWIAKVDTTTTKILWATAFGGTGNDCVQGLAVDPAGGVSAAFQYSTSLLVGGATLPAPGGPNDIGIVRLDSKGGGAVAFGYGSATIDRPQSIAVNRWGEVVVGGYIGATTAFGTKLATASSGSAGDGFLAKLSPTGAGQWAYGIGGSGGTDEVTSVAVDRQGLVAAVGTLGTLDGSGSEISFFGNTVNVGAGKRAAFLVVTNP